MHVCCWKSLFSCFELSELFRKRGENYSNSLKLLENSEEALTSCPTFSFDFSAAGISRSILLFSDLRISFLYIYSLYFSSFSIFLNKLEYTTLSLLRWLADYLSSAILATSWFFFRNIRSISSLICFSFLSSSYSSLLLSSASLISIWLISPFNKATSSLRTFYNNLVLYLFPLLGIDLQHALINLGLYSLECVCQFMFLLGILRNVLLIMRNKIPPRYVIYGHLQLSFWWIFIGIWSDLIFYLLYSSPF